VVQFTADDLACESIVNVPKRGLGDANVQLLHDHGRKRKDSAFDAARRRGRGHDELSRRRAEPARPTATCSTDGAASATGAATTMRSSRSSRRDGYTEMWPEGPVGGRAGAGRNMKETGSARWKSSRTQWFLEHISLVSREDGRSDDARLG